jgi:hypothetical protein
VYDLQEWSLSGEITRNFVVEGSKWFPTEVAGRVSAGTLRANQTTPELVAIWEDAQGLLWVVGRATQSGKIDESNPARRGVATVDPATVPPLRTLIEVIDPATRTMVASKAVDGVLYRKLDSGLLYNLRETAEGYVTVEVWRVSVR